DIAEALVNSVPNIKFGLAFCEASGDRLIRHDGNDEDLRKLAVENARKIGAGHTFIVYIKDAWPINVLNSLKMVPEITTIYCATANPVQLVIAESNQGRGVIGVIDGYTPLGVEEEDHIKRRIELLRKIGYKRG
ncbi:MAG: adenosine monophosphate-protein transferase, partial [Thermoprotei archaeon]